MTEFFSVFLLVFGEDADLSSHIFVHSILQMLVTDSAHNTIGLSKLHRLNDFGAIRLHCVFENTTAFIFGGICKKSAKQYHTKLFE